MTKEERHSLILQQLIKNEAVQVTDLATLLSVSVVTIRKDLNELEQKAKLYRSHGKAILINPYINNRSLMEKEKLAISEKTAIGRYAATLIAPNDSIIIASGTTVQEFARCIKPVNRLTVISASLGVSQILASNEAVEIVQLGGILRHTSVSTVGKYAMQPLHDVSCSKLFMGVDGIDPTFGITTTDLREADLNREMIKAAQKAIVLADSSKFRRRGFSKIATLDEIDLVITDTGIPDTVASQVESLGIELIAVDPQHPDSL